MEQNISDGMCRCCASEGSFKDFQTTYHWMGEEEIYSEMIKECFDLSLSTSDLINNGGICEVCITQLRNAFNFKRQVQMTEEQFKKKVHETVFKSNTIKLEVSRDDDDDDDDAEELSDFEIEIKEEKIEDKSKKRQEMATTSKAKTSKAEGETSKHDQETQTTNVKRNPETRKVMKNVKNKRLNLRVKSNNQKEVTKHQSNLREILLNSNATPIRCRGGIGYACCFCSEQFPEAANLKKHTLDTHGDDEKANFMKGKEMFGFFVKMDITGLKCKLCEENIDGLEKLVDHLRDVHEKYFFTDIKNHILPFKFQDEILECVVCSNVFNTFKALQEHMNVHYRNYICKICDAGFVNKNILLRHGDAHKTGTFTCEICSKTFNTARKRLLHSRAHHPGKVLPHKCGYCQERFPESRKKQEHLLTKHGIKPTIIKCNACDKTFDRKHSWRMHSTRVHLMVRDFKCSVCEMEFYTKVELENHMVKHTGTKKFKCELCSKGYGRHKTLIEHIKRAHF